MVLPEPGGVGGGELKLDGKMRIVVYMIYKVAYITEFWK